MKMIFQDFLYPISPILSLVMGAVILTILQCFPEKTLYRIKTGVAIGATIASLIFTAILWNAPAIDPTAPLSSLPWLAAFQRTYTLDTFSQAFFLESTAIW